MSILSGNKIHSEVETGRIIISPFSIDQLNPVSYDVRLGDRFSIYEVRFADLDTRKENNINNYTMTQKGLWLSPDYLYLMHTVERVYTEHYVPIMDGKSSIARLGISIHQTAGFGDPGFDGQYTLEVTVIHPVRVYAGMKIGQFRFHHIDGEVTSYKKKGNYVGTQLGPVSSRSFKQFGG